MFKRFKKCKHLDSEIVGKYYKVHLSPYTNGCDEISIYILTRCLNCGEFQHRHISNEEFLPERYYKESKTEKEALIHNLRQKGFVMRHELVP